MVKFALGSICLVIFELHIPGFPYLFSNLRSIQPCFIRYGFCPFFFFSWDSNNSCIVALNISYKFCTFFLFLNFLFFLLFWQIISKYLSSSSLFLLLDWFCCWHSAEFFSAVILFFSFVLNLKQVLVLVPSAQSPM